MSNGKVVIVGIGPGSKDDITPAVRKVLETADVVVGYKHYFDYVIEFIPLSSLKIDTGMKMEVERAEIAISHAIDGKFVCVISSGDSGIYGMAPLVYQLLAQKQLDLDIEVIPGISAFQKAASLLGAPIGHDMCIISLSDLMTPWKTIEKRVVAAAEADFVAAIYNPKSEGRFWQLNRLKEIYLMYRNPDTPVGIVKQAGREGEKVEITTLKDFNVDDVDMFTVVLIGNSQSYIFQIKGNQSPKIITPRGYLKKIDKLKYSLGREIMIESFQTIKSELKNKDRSLNELWPILHAIHTTADFEMEQIVKVDKNAMSTTLDLLKRGQIKHIITDVTMVKAGIRKAAAERFGIEVICNLNEDTTVELSKKNKITRSQAGIRLAVEQYPEAMYVFGNAPTALMELAILIKRGKANPCGIIAAPVGFVNVEESKHMIKPFINIPKIIIEGRKGGSSLAATLVNSILSFEDAESLLPGRDV